jgi:hypothetical protein
MASVQGLSYHTVYTVRMLHPQLNLCVHSNPIFVFVISFVVGVYLQYVNVHTNTKCKISCILELLVFHLCGHKVPGLTLSTANAYYR